MTPRRLRGRAAAGTGALALGLLAGCAAPPPAPNPPGPPDEPLPVLTVNQSDAVLTALGETLAAADPSGDAGALDARVTDPARGLRAAQYTLAERSDGDRPPPPITTDDDVIMLGAAEAWPRTFMAVTAPPEGSATPLLLVLRQADARSPFRLHSWARLFPGVETPEMAGPEIGSRQLAADAEGLVVTPAEALDRYADVLATGEASEHDDSFTPDPYVQQLQSELQAGRSSLEGIAEIRVNGASSPESIVALETTDGGALVVGVVRTSTDYKKTLSGATLRLGGEAGDWLGDGNVPALANVVHDSMVVFYVPPADSEGKIAVLGAEPVLVAASKV